MNLSPNEAEEALADILRVTQKTRHSLASSGAYIFLIITGVIWLVSFLATQFLPAAVVPTIWVVMSVIGSAISVVIGRRQEKRVHAPSTGVYARRIIIFWVMLVLFAVGVIAVARPDDGKQLTMIIILFILLGQMAMGLLFSFTSTWWALPIAALALAGYFFLPGLFYLWMGLLVGGSMIGLGLYIRLRW